MSEMRKLREFNYMKAKCKHEICIARAMAKIPDHNLSLAFMHDARKWASENVDINCYTVDGFTYWFENGEDAVMFKIKFGLE